MEFTYDGVVRYGFGFYNPNHAAAFICALLPFAWGMLLLQRRIAVRLLGAAITLTLLTALAFTYSRAGLAILVLELVLFCAVFRFWKYGTAMIVCFIFVTLLVGGGGRIVFDSAMSNRIDIWLAGASLLKANPSGVGIGNSGEIVSAFLLPDGVVCRTLVNSHLTLLCEFGVLFGFAWLGAISYALIKGFPNAGIGNLRNMAYLSFVGLSVSAGFSSIFDWDALFSFDVSESRGVINTALSWCLMLFFALLWMRLICGRFVPKSGLYAALSAFICIGMLFVFNGSNSNAPMVRTLNSEKFVSNSNKPKSIVLFDDSYNLISAYKMLKRLRLDEKICMPLESWQRHESLPEAGDKGYILFGACADFAEKAPDGSELILVKPSPFMDVEFARISKVYLPRYDSKYDALKNRLSELEIPTDDL